MSEDAYPGLEVMRQANGGSWEQTAKVLHMVWRVEMQGRRDREADVARLRAEAEGLRGRISGLEQALRVITDTTPTSEKD